MRPEGEPRIEIDTSEWPLVRVRYPAGDPSDEEVRSYLGRLGAFAVAGARFATLTDMTRVRMPPSAAQLWLFAAWLRRYGDELQRASAGNAVVADSPAMRSVVETAYWDGRDTPLFRLFSALDEAECWCRARLAGQESGPIPAGPAVPVPGLPPAGAESYDLMAEPVFLVRADGTVAFANRAARAQYRDPPSWLPAAVSGDAGSTPPARVARIDANSEPLFMVVPSEGAALADLPPSLERIARLICRGLSDKQIAASTELTLPTVRTYVRRLYSRAGVHSRGELIRLWYGGR